MDIHSMHFNDKIRKKIHKISLNVCFLELSEKILRDSKTGSNQPR